MQKTISILIALLVLGAGAWYFATLDREHDHDDHTDELVAKEPVRADGEFTIATSFYPLAFALETLTAGVATVTNIGAGQDPHDIQLSAANVQAMETADFVVLQGAGLEPWTEDIKAQLERAEVPVLLATAKLNLREGDHSHDHAEEEHAAEHDHAHDEAHGDEHGHTTDTHSEDEHVTEEAHSHDEHGHDEHDHHDHGAYDPHTWLDPVLFSETVGELVEALSTLDPENATLYAERGAALQAELATIHTAYETRLATCTYREVITSHDAFSYVGARYGFTIHTIAGLSTQDQPSAQTLAMLGEEVAEGGVGAILLEENSIAAYGETLAAETGLRTLSINPIAYAIPDGETYLTMMEQNLAVFADALQCS